MIITCLADIKNCSEDHLNNMQNYWEKKIANSYGDINEIIFHLDYIQMERIRRQYDL